MSAEPLPFFAQLIAGTEGAAIEKTVTETGVFFDRG